MQIRIIFFYLILTVLPFFGECQVLSDSLLPIIQNPKFDYNKRISAAISLIEQQYMLQDVEKATSLALEMKELAIEQQDDFLIAKLDLVLGRSLSKLNKYDASISHYQLAIVESKTKGFSELEMEALNSLARLHSDRGNYMEALQIFNRGLQLSSAAQDTVRQATFLNNVGFIHLLHENYDDAILFFKQGLKLCQISGQKRMEAFNYNNIGTALEGKGKLEEGFEYFNKSLEIKKEIQDLRGVAYSMGSMSGNLIKQKQYRSALVYANKSLDIRKQVKDVDGQIKASYLIARIHQMTGECKEAIRAGEVALEMARKQQLSKEIAQLSKLMYECYTLFGEEKKALAMVQLYLEHNAKTESVAIQKALMKSKLEAEFKRKTLSDSLQYLKDRENDLILIQDQKAELAFKKWGLYALSAGIVLLLLLALLLYRSKQRADLDGILISEQHLQLQKQHKEIQKINFLLESQNEEIISFNENLEAQVLERTKDLAASLEQLQNYQWQLSHKIRAPLARLMGLIQLIQHDRFDSEDNSKVIGMLQETSKDIDVLISEIGNDLEH